MGVRGETRRGEKRYRQEGDLNTKGLTLTYRLQLCVLCDIKAATINIFILTVDQKAMCMLALYREVHLFQHLSAHSCGV